MHKIYVIKRSWSNGFEGNYSSLIYISLSKDKCNEILEGLHVGEYSGFIYSLEELPLDSIIF